MEMKKKNIVSDLLSNQRESGLLLILLLMGVILSVVADGFLTVDNIFNILKQTTLVTIIAAGQTFIITSGGIDLSVGYSMTLSSMILAYMLTFGLPVPAAIVLGILASVLVGLANGLLITTLRLPPFIITLGMSNIVKGIILVMSKGYIVSLTEPFIIWLGQGTIGKMPVMVLFIPAVAGVMAFILNKTVFGNHVKAVGGNEEAAVLSGIHAAKVRIMIYVLAGLLCGIAGIIVTGRLNGGNPNAAGTYDMDSIAAVIVGGTSLAGGSGTVMGTVLGALLMILIRNGLVLLQVNMYWQTVAIGVVIILVCALDGFSRMRKD